MHKTMIEEIRREAKLLWNLQGKWSVNPIGKGCIPVRFEKKEDFDMVWTGLWRAVENRRMIILALCAQG